MNSCLEREAQTEGRDEWLNQLSSDSKDSELAPTWTAKTHCFKDQVHQRFVIHGLNFLPGPLSWWVYGGCVGSPDKVQVVTGSARPRQRTRRASDHFGSTRQQSTSGGHTGLATNVVQVTSGGETSSVQHFPPIASACRRTPIPRSTAQSGNSGDSGALSHLN